MYNMSLHFSLAQLEIPLPFISDLRFNHIYCHLPPVIKGPSSSSHHAKHDCQKRGGMTTIEMPSEKQSQMGCSSGDHPPLFSEGVVNTLFFS